jgi:hypothetical protein
MYCECGELIDLPNGTRVNGTVKAEIDSNNNVTLLSVKQWMNIHTCKVGDRAIEGGCLLPILSEEVVDELKESILGHFQD